MAPGPRSQDGLWVPWWLPNMWHWIFQKTKCLSEYFKVVISKSNIFDLFLSFQGIFLVWPPGQTPLGSQRHFPSLKEENIIIDKYLVSQWEDWIRTRLLRCVLVWCGFFATSTLQYTKTKVKDHQLYEHSEASFSHNHLTFLKILENYKNTSFKVQILDAFEILDRADFSIVVD